MIPAPGVATIYLVDDDPGVQRALSRVLREEGWHVVPFDSAEAFLAGNRGVEDACIVLDVSMPGQDGLALQRSLVESGCSLPVVFVTGHGDISMSVRAMKAGAVDFLTKPVDALALTAAVRNALAEHARQRKVGAGTAMLRERFARLTSREREVFSALTTGKLNKQIAADLGVVEQTVKFHRARLMERLGARTAAELMHIAAQLGIGPLTAPGDETSRESRRRDHQGH